MAKGGRRSTTWASAWKSGKTTVIRVPEVLSEELLQIARVLDEGGTLSVTDDSEGRVTDDRAAEGKTLRERAGEFLMTIPPRERKEAKRVIDRFLKSLGRA